MRIVYPRADAGRVTKHGVDMWIHAAGDESPNAGVVYQETPTGHAEEFAHDRSAFVFYIIEGEGTWVVDGEEHPVKATDVVIVPPGKRFHYRGTLKQVCVTAPAWSPEHERHVRFVDLPDAAARPRRT